VPIVEPTSTFSWPRTMDNFIKIEKIGEGECPESTRICCCQAVSSHALHHAIIINKYWPSMPWMAIFEGLPKDCIYYDEKSVSFFYTMYTNSVYISHPSIYVYYVYSLDNYFLLNGQCSIV